MARYPYLLYDQFRPGIENATQGQDWDRNRYALEALIYGVAKAAGAVVGKTNYEGEKPEDAKGDVMIMSLERQEPPMSPDEALELGERVVSLWKVIEAVKEVPSFCDTVLLMPEATEASASSAQESPIIS